MASIALSAAGQALGNLVLPGVGGFAGQALGGVAGAYIDSKWLPGLLGADDEVRELSDISPQTANEGSPVPFCLGPRNRVAGTVIWHGELEAETDTDPAKGSQSAPNPGPTTKYFQSVAIAYHFDPRIRISRLLDIVAEGKRIFRAESTVEVESNLLSVEVLVLRDYQDASASNIDREIWMEVVSPNGGPDLQALESGVDATVSGFSNAGNNGTFRCIGVDVDTATGIQRARFRNSGAVAESASSGVKAIDQDLPQAQRRWFDAIRIYNGSPSQEPDPLIEEAEDGPVPAFRGVAYVVIERLRVTEWGGRLPQLTFLVEESQQRSLQSALGVMLERAGMPYTDFDVGAVTGDLVGLTLAGPARGIDTIAPILVGHDISAREEGGKIVFFPREAALEVELEESILGASEDPNDRGEPYSESDSDGDGKDLPRVLQVFYRDTGNSLQEGMQRAFYPQAQADSVEDVRLALALSPAQAKRRAQEMLWGRVANARVLRTTLPPSRIDIGVGSRFTLFGETWLIGRHSLRDNGIAEIEAMREWTETDWSHVAAQGSPEDSVEQEMPAEHLLAVADAAPLRDQDWNNGPNGYYWGHAVGDTTVEEHGCRHVSGLTAGGTTTNGSGNQIGVECTMGWTETALPAMPFEYLDRVSTLDVRLLNGELESKTRDEVSRGENWAQIGREIVGFETVTLLGTRRYRLSNLHRGLRGTNVMVGTHAIGEPFVLLEADKLKLFVGPTQLGYVDGATIYRHAVPPGARIADFTALQAEFRAGAKRPTHPYPVTAARDLVAATFTLRWVRRVPLNGSQLPSPYRSGARYRIELAATIGGATLLTVSPQIGSNQASEQSWTSTQLSAVGLTYTSPIVVRIQELRTGANSHVYELSV